MSHHRHHPYVVLNGQQQNGQAAQQAAAAAAQRGPVHVAAAALAQYHQQQQQQQAVLHQMNVPPPPIAAGNNHHHPSGHGAGNGSGSGDQGRENNSGNAAISHLLRDLAFVRRRPIEGSNLPSMPASFVRPWNGPTSSRPKSLATASSGAAPPPGNGNNGLESKSVDFLYYSDSEDEDEVDAQGGEREKECRVSCNFTDCLKSRELGDDRRFTTMRLTGEYGTRHMLSNSMLKEYPIKHKGMNKIFCSQWLSHRQIVFGTKCNKLMVYDVNTRHMEQISSLCNPRGSGGSLNNPLGAQHETGIHSIEINPSRTLLATGGRQPSELAVYQLPTMDPVCIGERAHSDIIFDLTWLDDQFVVSGSRDGTLALWRVTDAMVDAVAERPDYAVTQPLWKKQCKAADKVRALTFNPAKQEIAVISLNGYIHCWDGARFKQVMSKKLPHNMENVCLATDEDAHMYAVGSKANVDLLDARTLQAIKKIPSRNSGCGIRSVSFKDNILTIGTGIGVLLFWDLRAGKYLESTMNSNRAVTLKCSRGWVQRDDHFMDHHDMPGQGGKNMPAIYTHCYDSSGTRLFAAGGPLQCSIVGNYMGLFQ